MDNYNPKEIEARWQQKWEKSGLCKAEDFSKKPKVFLLVEFPYPSGAGLHVGHCRSYTAMDIIARKRRMEGWNVLFPMGWDAFGLPTENYAVKTGIHPAIATKQNTEIFKQQEKSLGLSFDWEREINTTDPAYYKWTQWIFLKLFEHGLAYKSKIPINWCLSCKIGLANEEVVDGQCERCSGEIEKREKDQWLIKITEYAERLAEDLDLVDFPERVKMLQRDWIGKSNGWEIKFKIQIPNLKSLPKANSPQAENSKSQIPNKEIRIFTTRIDTIFGCTYLVVAPEHEILKELKESINNWQEVDEYVEKAKKKSERDRQEEGKEKTGVRLDGVVAINPANSKEIPVFLADYVLAGYGTGAIMAVPAHDQRDMDFAKKYKLDIIPILNNIIIIYPNNIKIGGRYNAEVFESVVNEFNKFGKTSNKDFLDRLRKEAYEVINREIGVHAILDEGILFDSGQFDGMRSEVAREKIGVWLKEKGSAKKQVNYKLRDWVFSRQRYWGEPIPLVFCEKCGWVAIPEKDLPVVLPDIKDYKPTDAGDSPLSKAGDWVNVKCPKCCGSAKRETDVMPNWAGSNWYFLRYCDPYNNKEFASKEKLKYWMPTDWYNGGMEHTTLHLLYSRFIYKFLWDIGEVPKELGSEPYKKRTSHGMILAEGGVKMSKSKSNVINPDEIVKQYGADTLRVYEMFMGPFEQAIAWNEKGVKGAYRFLKKIYGLLSQVSLQPQISNLELNKLLHKTTKKVGEDIEAMKFNTAVSALMILTNEMVGCDEIPSEIFEKFILILAPFTPHLAEELWEKLAKKGGALLQNWPKYDIKLVVEEKVNLIVQINGKVRDTIEINRGISESEAREIALGGDKVKQWISGKEIKKNIFVKDKLINFVI